MVSPGEVAADIGTDHAFVPIFLVRNGIVKRAIASDVKKGPIERAEEHIADEGLEDRIDVRLGDGLRTLGVGEADRVILAGMGGRLMIRLLSDSKEVTQAVPELILSPHSEIPDVRRFLMESGFRIEDEAMEFEDGKYYTVIRAVNAAAKGRETGKASEETEATEASAPAEPESEVDPETAMEFGPVLLRERPPVFSDWLRAEARKTKTVLKRLEKAAPTEKNAKRKAEAEQRLARIEAVLKN